MALQAPATQRDQLLLIGAIVGIAAIVLYYMYVWTPKAETMAVTQTRLDTLIAQNRLAQAEVARGTASQLKEEAEQYGRMLGVMRTLVPTQNEVPALINQISTAARRTGLEIDDIAPLSVIPGDIFDTHKYRLSVTGPYHRIAQLLTNIGSMTRIVAPMNVSLSPARDPQNPRPGEQMLDAQFEIQTYVAKAGVARAP
jgi:type IV pilus assembly protein PilO